MSDWYHGKIDIEWIMNHRLKIIKESWINENRWRQNPVVEKSLKFLRAKVGLASKQGFAFENTWFVV